MKIIDVLVLLKFNWNGKIIRCLNSVGQFTWLWKTNMYCELNKNVLILFVGQNVSKKLHLHLRQWHLCTRDSVCDASRASLTFGDRSTVRPRDCRGLTWLIALEIHPERVLAFGREPGLGIGNGVSFVLIFFKSSWRHLDKSVLNSPLQCFK